jgi:hypothetical protein
MIGSNAKLITKNKTEKTIKTNNSFFTVAIHTERKLSTEENMLRTLQTQAVK